MPEQVNLVTPQQPTTTVATKNQINWKNVLLGIVIGAILVGLVVITFWYFTKPKESGTSTVTTAKTSTSSAKTATTSAQKDETANWKVYTNERIGYTIKAPPDWIVSADEGYQYPVSLLIQANQSIKEGAATTVSEYIIANSKDVLHCTHPGLSYEDCLKKIPGGAYLSVNVKYSSHKTIDDYVSFFSKYSGPNSFVLTSESILGRKTYEFGGSNCPKCYVYETICATCSFHKIFVFDGKDNYTYQITEVVASTTNNQLQTYLNSILKTLKINS